MSEADYERLFNHVDVFVDLILATAGFDPAIVRVDAKRTLANCVKRHLPRV